MIEVKAQAQTDALTILYGSLSSREIRIATSRAINYALRRTRTQMARETVDDYRMKYGDVLHNLKPNFSNTSTLYGEMLAKSRPESLGHFNPVQIAGNLKITGKTGKRDTLKRPGGRAGVFFEIVRGKGKENIKSAFIVFNNLKPIVFARGKYNGSAGFGFSKSRLPITKINTKSVYWGVLHPKVSAPWHDFSEDAYFKELQRQLDLLASQAAAVRT